MNIRSLIIDDDPFMRDLLEDKLKQHLPEVEIVATASSGMEGSQKIADHSPDLVFLDVEMEDMTGFEMLTELKDINFQTIFITSYSHYAIKAIRFNSLDYLVKPFDLGELRNAIQRYKKVSNKKVYDENLKLALLNKKTEDVSNHQLVLRTQEGEIRLAIKNIVRVEGERNYSYIYLKDGSKKLVAKTLSDLEELLVDKGLFRCHRSHLVNFSKIAGVKSRLFLTMSDGVEVPISRRKKDSFIRWFEGKK
jgi:two-component system LytT family response regulator